jgi:NADH-quinone oxidoreductase subunit J
VDRHDLIHAILAIIFGGTGTYLMLPHKHGARTPRTLHIVGAGLGVFGLLFFSMLWSAPGDWISSLLFYACGFMAIIGAVLTITNRDPTHSALWFAAVVLATSGLFLQAGAQFLAAGTVIVYAGAIIVTFLFVIMLAQMEGRAPYDRAARAPFRATWICFMLLFGVLWSLLHVVPDSTAPIGMAAHSALLPTQDILVDSTRSEIDRTSVQTVIARSVRPTALLRDASGRLKPHVAGLGETLYTDHLIIVELAGSLLFVALIGALVIATPKAPTRPGANNTANA